MSNSSQSIKANHTSPDGLQGENITFTLQPTALTGGCHVSVSICHANSLTLASIIYSHIAVSCYYKIAAIALQKEGSIICSVMIMILICDELFDSALSP